MPENDMECSIPQCKNKAATRCKFCGRDLCDFHLKPKHTASMSYIASLTDPDLIKIYKEDNESGYGHPCPKYHEKWMKEYEESKNQNNIIDFDAIFDVLQAKLSGDPYSCNVFPCDNKPIHTCKICMKRYCSYHASRKPSKLSQLGGHVCVR